MCLAHLEHVPCVRLVRVSFCCMAVNMVSGNRARGPIIQNVARSTNEIAACSMLIKCIRGKLLSTGITDSADGSLCSLRSRDVFHKVLGLSSMKFSKTRIEQERNQNKETRLHMRK